MSDFDFLALVLISFSTCLGLIVLGERVAQHVLALLAF